MINKQSHRKDEHVSLAIKFYNDNSNAGFDEIRFIHQGVPEISVSDVDYSTSFDGINMNIPFYIEAMTGGSSYTKKLNEKLARIAKKTGLAMATGSQSVALKDSSESSSFEIVRNTNPDGIIFSNIGSSVDSANAQKAIEMMHSDALEVHINTPQELIMPEGDRDFYWLDNIRNIVNAIDKPVIVKEVGFGMVKETIAKLTDIGVKNINISGNGGTNFAQIENYRRKHQELSYLDNWGQSTVESLFEAYAFSDDVNILASGGIRTPLDIVKSLSLGAKAVGMAAPILYSLIKNGEEATVEMIEEYKNGIKIIMTMLGARNISDLKKQKLILSSDLLAYLKQRGITY